MAYPSPRQLQLRRGNAAAVASYTGLAGELTVNTSDWTLYVHDGSTAGGHAATVNTSTLTDQISSVNANITVANVGMKGYVDQGNSIQAAAITSSNIGMRGYVDATVASNIANIAVATTYSNVNVRTYLGAFDGNIIPSANSVYSLGSITNQWHHLYVSSNTIYIGGTPLTITNGNLTVGGNVVSGTGGTNLVTYSGNVSASAITLSGATGPIANVAVIDAGSGFVPMSFYATSGGSGTGYSVAYSLAYTPPFASFYSHGDGYRVGDIITVINDPGVGKSNATVVVTELLGVASPGIFVGNTAYKFGADGNLKLPLGGGIVDSSGVSVLGSGGNVANLWNAGQTLSVNSVGNVIFPTGSQITNGYPGTHGSVGDGTSWFVTPSGSSGGVASADGQQYIQINDGQGVLIGTGWTGSGHEWTFGRDGNLTFPAGATIGQTTSNTAIFTAAIGDVLELQSSSNNNRLQVSDNMISILMGDSHWHFDDYGKLTLPSGANITSYGGGVTTIRDDNGVVISKDGLNAFSVTDATGVRILSNGYVWNFNPDASTTFPGNVVISGNLTVNGNVNYISVNNVVIGDNIINLADLNPADSLDLGFAAHRTPFGQPLQHTGLVRQASTNSWKLFSNVVPAPGTTVDFTYAVYDDLQVGNITSPTITGINANVAAANVGIIGYIDLANTIQSQQISAANVGMKGYVDSLTYSNVQVATYLPTYTGNFGGNITHGDKTWAFDGLGVLTLPAVSSAVIEAASNNLRLKAYNNILINSTNGGTIDIGDDSLSGNVRLGRTGSFVNVNGRLQFSDGTTVSPGNVSVAGNVTATYFIGNGALLTGIAASSSYSNVQVATYLPTYTGNIANIRLGVSGVLTFPDGTTQITAASGGGTSYSNVNVAAYLNTQGYNLYSNVNVAAYLATGLSSNIVVGTGAYFVGNVSATTTMQYGAGQGGLLFTKLVGGTGAAIYNLNVVPSAQNYALSTNGAALNLNAPTGGGIYSSINNSIVTTVTAGYLNVAGNVSAANVSASYVNVTGNVSAANVSAQYLFGDGSNLTNMYSNVNVTNYLPSHTGNVGVNYLLGTTPNVTLTAGSYNSTFDTLGNVSLPNVYVSGNIIAQNFVGNGAFLTGLPAGFSNVQVAAYLNATGYNLYSNANVASYLPLYGGDISARNITVSGNISLTGNILQINSAVFYGNTITGFGSLYAGIPGYTVIPQVVAQFTENFNGYAQINSQNLGIGSQASTDFVATANNGTDSAYFVDLGIAGGGYDPAVAANNNAIGTALYANDAYLYTAGNTAVNTGGNLIIGVQTLNKNIKFFAGGVNANNVVLTIQGNGITTAGNVTGTYFIGSGQFLTGLPTAYSNVNVQAYTESMGFQNYGNVNVAALITTNGLTNYSNVNTAAYLNSQGYNLYSNVNVIAYLAGNITVGNITATYFTGNGAFLTGISTGSNYSNVNVAIYLGNVSTNINPVPNDIWGLGAENKEWYSAHIKNAYIKETIQAYSGGGYSGGNSGELLKSTGSGIAWQEIKTVNGNSLFGNGDISISGSYSNVNVATYLPTYSGNVANIRLGVSGVLTFADGTTQTTASTGGGSNYSNVNVAAYLNTQGYNLYSNVNVASYLGTGQVTVSNIKLAASGNIVFADGSVLNSAATIGGNYSNVNVAVYLPTYGGTIQSSNVQTTTANIQATTAATNPATGALRVMGGVGVAGAVVAAQLNSTGNVLANAISAYSLNTVANVTASVINAGTINSSGNVLAQNIIGTIATASQPSITAVGTLATLSVTGNATVGNLVGSEANTRIIANTYVTTFDIYGNVTFPGNITVGGLGVTMPTRPAFRVNGTSLYGGAQSTANVNLKGVAVSTAYNQGSYFDATTGKFTAPIAGIYEVLLNARVNGSFNGLAQLVVLKNGLNSAGNIVAFWETTSNTAGATHFGVSGTVMLATGDYLSANILVGNVTFDQNDNWSVTYLG